MKPARHQHTFGSLFAVLTACLALLLGSGTAARGDLYQYGNACNDCHAMPPIDAAFRNITTGAFRGSHATHNPASDAPKAACQKCHAGSASYETGHMNGFV